MTGPPRETPSLVVWWIIWSAILSGLVITYMALQGPSSASSGAGIRYAPLVPLLLATVIRWLLLPRMVDGIRAFPLFVVGLALAESCGILGIFLTPDLSQTYFLLGVCGITQFVPTFAGRSAA